MHTTCLKRARAILLERIPAWLSMLGSHRQALFLFAVCRSMASVESLLCVNSATSRTYCHCPSVHRDESHTSMARTPFGKRYLDLDVSARGSKITSRFAGLVHQDFLLSRHGAQRGLERSTACRGSSVLIKTLFSGYFEELLDCSSRPGPEIA